MHMQYAWMRSISMGLNIERPNMMMKPTPATTYLLDMDGWMDGCDHQCGSVRSEYWLVLVLDHKFYQTDKIYISIYIGSNCFQCNYCSLCCMM
jgi:hypothetical protein